MAPVAFQDFLDPITLVASPGQLVAERRWPSSALEGIVTSLAWPLPALMIISSFDPARGAHHPAERISEPGLTCLTGYLASAVSLLDQRTRRRCWHRDDTDTTALNRPGVGDVVTLRFIQAMTSYSPDAEYLLQ